MSAAVPDEAAATGAALRAERTETLALLHRYVIIASVAFVLLAASVGVEVLRSQIAIEAVRQDAKALTVVNAAITRQEAIAKALVERNCLASRESARILRLTIASKVALDSEFAKVDESGIPNAPNPLSAEILRELGRLSRERAVADGSELAAYTSQSAAPCVIPTIVK